MELTLSGAPGWASGSSGDGAAPTAANYGRYATFLGDLAQRLDRWSTHGPCGTSPTTRSSGRTRTRSRTRAFSRRPTQRSNRPIRARSCCSHPSLRQGPGLNGNGGSGSINPYDFLTRAYDAGIRGSVDAVGWNLYPPGAPEDAFNDSSGRPYAGSFPGQLYLHDLLEARDPGKHVWITEFGWATCDSCQQNSINGTSEATQADYLSRSWSYARRYLPWVDVLFWYEAADGSSPSTWERSLGLLRSDGTAKPAFKALSAVANTNGGSSGGSTGSGTLPGTGGGTTTGVKPKPTPKVTKVSVCTVSSVVRSRGKVVLNVGAFTPKPHRGFFNLTFAVLTRSKSKTTIRIDGERGTKWLSVTTLKLTRSSRIRVKLRDRGYVMVRVRASSTLGKACRARAPIG